MRDVFIGGVGMTLFGKHPDRSLRDLGREACLNTIRESGINKLRIQHHLKQLKVS